MTQTRFLRINAQLFHKAWAVMNYNIRCYSKFFYPMRILKHTTLNNVGFFKFVIILGM